DGRHRASGDGGRADRDGGVRPADHIPPALAGKGRPMRNLRLGLALLLLAFAAPAAAEPVAITFDDLPTMALSPDTPYAAITTKSLLGGLKRLHIPATGFVNEVKLEARDRPARIGLLTEWLDAGMDL